MKLLYLAGPFSDDDPIHGVARNVLAASEIALEAARKGWMPVCPHKNTQDFQHAADIPPEFWYEGDLDLMRRCDAVLMLPGYERSQGALRELEVATAEGMGVYYYAEFDEVPEACECYWSGPVDRASTRDLVEELWSRPGVRQFLLGDEDVVTATECGSLVYTLVSPEKPAANLLIIEPAAYLEGSP